MTKKLTKPQGDGRAVKLVAEEGRSEGFLAARAHLDIAGRHAVVTKAATEEFFGGEATCGVAHHMEALDAAANGVADGDLTVASRTLTAQAMTLDALFTQMARRAETAIGKYPDAVDRYMRLAFKAQTQSRAAFEALIRLHQPREQTVRHIHVGPDGQAVFIENYHGAQLYGKPDDRPHGTGSSGPALLGAHPSGQPLPIASSEGEAPMPIARRRGRVRRAAGE